MRSHHSILGPLALLALVGTSAPAVADVVVDAGRGALTVHVPSTYDGSMAAPLVLSLHGYSLDAAYQEDFMPLLDLVDEYGFLLVMPEGTFDGFGNRFWNATNACCGQGVDDSGYLRALIEAISDELSVDDRRVFVTGHSNGGFMSYRMACDHADRIAAIASVAGATWLDTSVCTPSEPVHVLQIHGTADPTIQYGGGCTPLGCYPGAVESVETWATYDGCALEVEPGGTQDLDTAIAGAETTIMRYVSGCGSGGSGELWTIDGANHYPSFDLDSMRALVEYFLGHPKPTGCADVDGNGHVDVDDLVAVITSWGQSGVAADVTGDGVVNVDDIVAVVLGWGACG